MPDPIPNPGDGQQPPATGAKGATPPSDQGSGEPSSRRAIAREHIAANGGAERAVSKLLAENYRLRETRREVPQGAVILTGDDATAYQAFRELNLKPVEVSAALKERDDLKTWKGTRERQDQIGQIAGQVGYKPAVLTTLLAPKLAEGARLELRDVTVERNGKQETTKVAHLVTGTGDAAKAEPLTAVVERDFADFLPALKADGSGGRATTSGTIPAPHGGTPVTRYPAQRDTPAKGSADVDPLAHLQSRRVLPSQSRAKKLGTAAA